MADNEDGGHAGEPQPTSTDLFSSAKLLAAAGQTYFQGGTEEVEKEKVAGAAADLLGAASRYGKLEETSYGEYVEKAETYLEQYSSGGSAPVPAPAAADPAPAPVDAPEAVEPAPAHVPAPVAAEPAPDKAESVAKSEDGGAGEVLVKAARGLGGFFS